jgi:hypothetical protein
MIETMLRKWLCAVMVEWSCHTANVRLRNCLFKSSMVVETTNSLTKTQALHWMSIYRHYKPQDCSVNELQKTKIILTTYPLLNSMVCVRLFLLYLGWSTTSYMLETVAPIRYTQYNPTVFVEHYMPKPFLNHPACFSHQFYLRYLIHFVTKWFSLRYHCAS